MSKRNDDFFVEKKTWSVIKDELLSCYLKPYIQKILTTGKPICYVDCFAGKGKFDDGSNGSPIIALEIINKCINISNSKLINVKSYFIDLNYAKVLSENIKLYSNTKIISGKYEDNIKPILDANKGKNIFLYIDPYGIKALNFNFFSQFSNGDYNSIELLINMNSFGFLREGCRVMKLSSKSIQKFDDILNGEIIEYDSSQVDSSETSIKLLNGIAGGTYWQNIITDFQNEKISCFEAEKQFSKEYCNKLNSEYKFILNMPIRLKERQQPKYRMIHATNHQDGCILMFENICKRWEKLGDIQTNGQISLFEVNPDNEVINTEQTEKELLEFFQTVKHYTHLNILLANFFTLKGISCKPIDIRNILKKFEDNGQIEVKRIPAFTQHKNPKPTTFFTESSKQKVEIRCKS